MTLTSEPVYQVPGGYLMYFLLSLCGILTIYHFWLHSLRYVQLGIKMPGPTPWPIFGNALMALQVLEPTNAMVKILEASEQYGRVLRGFMGPKLVVGLSDPRDIELILGGTTHLEKADEYGLFKPWLGDGLLISKGEKWRTHRKMIAPTFHNSILKTFMPVFNKNSQHLIQKLKAEIGKTFDVHDYMSGTTVDILLETAMGVKKTKEDNTGFDYAMAVMNMCNVLHHRHYKFWLKPDFIFKFTKMGKMQDYLLDTIHSLTRGVIQRKKMNYEATKSDGKVTLYSEAIKETESAELAASTETPKNFNHGSALRDDLDDIDENDVGEKKRLAFLDFMIEASNMEGIELSDEEIKEEVDTIMFEGHDTTAAGSSFVLCMLGVHQDVQERVLQEINGIFQNSSRPVTFNDTLEMNYLERVILETLRMYPPVPLIARKVAKETKLASGDYTLPAGITVVIGTYGTHHLAEYYPNPYKFDPDNFLPEKCQQRHYYSFIPFSAGPRSCVGRKYAMLKLKVLIANIVRKFRIISDVEEKDFKLQADIILKRNDGFRIRVEERK